MHAIAMERTVETKPLKGYQPSMSQSAEAPKKRRLTLMELEPKVAPNVAWGG